MVLDRLICTRIAERLDPTRLVARHEERSQAEKHVITSLLLVLMLWYTLPSLVLSMAQGRSSSSDIDKKDAIAEVYTEGTTKYQHHEHQKPPRKNGTRPGLHDKHLLLPPILNGSGPFCFAIS